MKRFFTLFVIYIVFSSWFNASTAQAQGAPDRTLAAAVRRYLELRPTDPINWKALEVFSDMSGSIKSLKGLELATNLKRLELHNSPIDDLTPLANLEKLREITIWDSKLNDLTPLAGLIQLEFLAILNFRARNQISDLTPLSGLIQLEYLYTSDNEISDLTPLTGLTNLVNLGLGLNQISDITPLAGLTQLRSLSIGANQISDITPLAGLTQLDSLAINANQISDITPLARLTELEFLHFATNEISDITPLTGLTNLAALALSNNQINNITPLAGLTELEGLDLGGNQINDITPLAGLTQLRGLALGTNHIQDLSPLAGLTELQALFLARNQISNITPLTGLTELECLDLGENQITDADRLENLPKLTKLRLGGNPSDSYHFVIVAPNNIINFVIPGGVRSARDPKQETSPQETLPQETSPQSPVSTSVNEAELPPMYWVDSESNTLYGLTDGEVETLLPSVQNATSFAIDVANDKLYWTEQTSNRTGKIHSANLDGTNAQLVKNLTGVPHDIAFDAAGGKIYLTNSWGKIQRLNVDGSNFQADLITGLDAPRGLVLDVSEGGVYWTEMTGHIRRANLGGSNIQTVAKKRGMIGSIIVVGSYLYWTEKISEELGKISRANLDGSNVEDIITLSSVPVGIAVDVAGNKLYWTETRGHIQRANLDGANVEDIVTGLVAPGQLILNIPPPLTDTANMDRITISEIMVASNGGSLPQWIELHNGSDTHAVYLKGWTLEVQNRRSANFNGHLNVTLTFKEKFIEPQETLMIVSKQGRSSNNFSNEQIYNLGTLHPNLQDMVLSEEGFYLKLSNKAGELIDVVGNLDGKRNTDDQPAWPLPGSLTEEGARASMVRRHDDGVPRLGTDASGWISAMNTKLTTGTTTYYGHPNDIGAPGVKSGGALPVTLSHFRAERVEAGVVVKWTTESEVDNAGFNILRSETKNGEFKVVNPQLIQGAGTTSERHTYTWKDTAAQPNVAYYYRIEDVSHAGVRKQLATVRMRGLVSASGKLTTRWADLKL